MVSFVPQEQIAGWTVKNLQRFHQARVVRAAAGQSKEKTAFIECDIDRSASAARVLILMLVSGDNRKLKSRQLMRPLLRMSDPSTPSNATQKDRKWQFFVVP